MSRRQGAAVVLVLALGLLGGSVAWALDAARSDSWHGHHSGYGPGMMGLGYGTAKATAVHGIAEARQRAQAFAGRFALKTDEVMRFERNYYVKLVDAKGRSATEALVDPATGAVSLEYGPAMMWNIEYGPMGDGLAATAAVRVSPARAHILAQRWLDANEPGTRVERAGDAFPGYYTLETLHAGRISGMISVNATTGAVWPHTWHGRLLELGG